VTLNQERRRHWSAEEKAALVRETYKPSMNVSLVARKHGVDASQLLNLHKLEREGALTSVTAGESVLSASEQSAASLALRFTALLLLEIPGYNAVYSSTSSYAQIIGQACPLD